MWHQIDSTDIKGAIQTCEELPTNWIIWMKSTNALEDKTINNATSMHISDIQPVFKI